MTIISNLMLRNNWCQTHIRASTPEVKGLQDLTDLAGNMDITVRRMNSPKLWIRNKVSIQDGSYSNSIYKQDQSAPSPVGVNGTAPLDIMRQSACLVVNSITVYIYGFLLNCTRPQAQ